MSHNRLLTRDNLKKRRDVSDPTCLFCSEHESISHLFFECFVAVSVWKLVSEVLCVDVDNDYESVAKYWIANKKHMIANVVSSVVLRSLRN
jgi:predicted GNAT superfamily acetyltransferase